MGFALLKCAFFYGNDRVKFVFLFITFLLAVQSNTLRLLGLEATKKPDRLMETVANLILLQWKQPYPPDISAHREPLVVIVLQNQTQHWAAHLQRKLHHSDVRFVETLLDTGSNFELSINRALEILEYHIRVIPVVALFLEDEAATSALVRTVCSAVSLKWTHLHHTSEWILATTGVHFDLTLEDRYSCLQYFTCVIWKENNISLSRNSRRRKFKATFKGTWTQENIAYVFVDLINPKKITLEDMHLPIATFGNVKLFNLTNLRYFIIDFLQTLANALEFNYTLVYPQEPTVGIVLDNGTATGLIGMIARKEAAFSCAGISKIINRASAIDYLDTALFQTPIYITYKLPQADNDFDITLINIIKADFFLMIIGPAIAMALLGVVIHVSSRSCSSTVFMIPSKAEFRRCLSCPDHIFSQNVRVYTNHTGRILRTSWILFAFVVGAGYSAYLVTSFAVKPKELKLDSLQKLLDTPQFSFGIEDNPALIKSFQTSNDSDIQKIWGRIVEVNKTNSMIISENYTYHLQKILSGNYALIDNFNVKDAHLYLTADVSGVRSVQVRSLSYLTEGYTTVPKHVFYTDLLNMAFMRFEELGILRYLRLKHNIELLSRNNDEPPVNPKKSVSLSRIVFLLCLTTVGVGMSFVCLLIECLWGGTFRNSIQS